MQEFKIELNDMEKLIETYSSIFEKVDSAQKHITQAYEKGTQLMVAGSSKDTVYADGGMQLFVAKVKDFAATARLMQDYTAESLKKFVDMDKLMAKQMYEQIQKDANTSPDIKKYIEEHPEEASKDMYEYAKDREGFQKRKAEEYEQKKREAAQQTQPTYVYTPVRNVQYAQNTSQTTSQGYSQKPILRLNKQVEAKKSAVSFVRSEPFKQRTAVVPNVLINTEKRGQSMFGERHKTLEEVQKTIKSKQMSAKHSFKTSKHHHFQADKKQKISADISIKPSDNARKSFEKGIVAVASIKG